MSFFLPDPWEKKTNSRKWIWLLVLISVVAGICFLIPSASRQVRHLRAQRLRAQSEAFFHQQNYQQTFLKARASLELEPNDPKAIRLVALSLTAQGKEEALAIWSDLFTRAGASESDLRSMVGLAIKLKRVDVAERQMSELLKHEPLSAETLRLAAAYFDLRGDRPRAIRYARELAAADSADDTTLFLLGRNLIASSDSAMEALQGKQILLDLTHKTNQLAMAVPGVPFFQ